MKILPYVIICEQILGTRRLWPISLSQPYRICLKDSILPFLESQSNERNS